MGGRHEFRECFNDDSSGGISFHSHWSSMKYLAVIILILNAACAPSGGGGSAAPAPSPTPAAKTCSTWLNGTLRDATTHQVFGFFKDCSGYNQQCAEVYDLTLVASDNFTTEFKIKITASSGAVGCNPVGEYTCVFDRAGGGPTNVFVGCDTGASTTLIWMHHEQ